MERVPPDTLGSMRSVLEAMAETPLPFVGLQPGTVLWAARRKSGRGFGSGCGSGSALAGGGGSETVDCRLSTS